MKTSRKDIKLSDRDIHVPNSTSVGYSSKTLHKGDLFLYKERYTDGTFGKRLAKCHGQVKPNNVIDHEEIKWYILAQAANDTMTFTYERWVSPEDVIETVQYKYANDYILCFFLDKEN